MITKIKMKNYKLFMDEVEYDLNSQMFSIIGSNSSGKSVLYVSLYAIKGIMQKRKALSEYYLPYAFCEKSKTMPCELGLDFIVDGVKYFYNIKFDSMNIISESLKCGDISIIRRENSTVKLLDKEYDIDVKSMGISSLYLFGLAMSFNDSKNNDASYSHIKTVNDFLEKIFVQLDSFSDFIMTIEKDISVRCDLQDERVAKLVQKVDSTVFSIFTEVALQQEIDRNKDMNDKVVKQTSNTMKNIKPLHYNYISLHKCEKSGKLYPIDYNFESNGVKQMFILAPQIWKVLDIGGMLFIDDLDASINPDIITSVVIPLFSNKEVNKKNAQLVFTVHNISLLQNEHLKDCVNIFDTKKLFN